MSEPRQDAEVCATVSCPSGQVQCEGESPTRRCIRRSWICDGDNDCGNGWDEEQDCPEVTCRAGQVECGGESPRRRCIPSRYVCDGDNDCGNGWDENEEDCADLLATLTCPPGSFQCPANRRQCISEHWLCDGDNDCGDNSDEDPANCRTSVIVSLRQCQRAIGQQCVAPVYRPLEGLNRTQVYEKLVNTNLRELCEPVLTAQQCVGQVAQSEACSQLESHLDHPGVIAVERYLTVVNITVNHVCRENVEVFNEHKGCLLREMRGGIMRRIRQQCPNTSPTPAPCVPSSVLDCAENVVSQQCGAEIAGQLRALGTKVMEQYGCETHFEMKKKKMDHDFTGIKSMKKKKTHSLLDDMEEALHSLF